MSAVVASVGGVTHFAKDLRSLPPISARGRPLKRYVVDAPDYRIDQPVAEAMDQLLPALLPDLDEGPAGGWVVMHRTRAAAFLLAYSWVWDNVVELRWAAAGEPFVGCPDEDVTHFVAVQRPWIGCVWELTMLEHERRSWVRHVLEPDLPDLDAWLLDVQPSGTVT